MYVGWKQNKQKQNKTKNTNKNENKNKQTNKQTNKTNKTKTKQTNKSPVIILPSVALFRRRIGNNSLLPNQSRLFKNFSRSNRLAGLLENFEI